MKTLVLDASALIGGFWPSDKEECYSVPEVIKEIKKNDIRLKIQLSISQGFLKILDPPPHSVEKTHKAGMDSGDIALLSRTDLKILSLALYLKEKGRDPVIVTDDYDIQNLASILEIKHIGVAEMGIKKVLKWKKACKGCGKVFRVDYEGRCNVCGSKLIIMSA
jgi:UPF0271 protein